MSHDVGIIGGGLAGLTLSIQLAKKGYKVILFEKDEYPFHKVCGEYIAMESWNYLTACGMRFARMDVPRINRLRVSSPNGNTLEHALQPGGFGISRFTLDALLADEATQQGVELLQKTKVENVSFREDRFFIETANSTHEVKVAVGSYGKRSNIDVKLQRPFISKALPPQKNFVGVKYHVRVKNFDERFIELHNFKDGYCGISKVEGDLYCLCYLTTAHNLRVHDSIADMEQKTLQRNPFLKKYFTEAEFLYDAPLVISQINFEDKAAIEDHLFMAGDAAGLIAPLCGNGMSMALHASKILSDLVPFFLDGNVTRSVLERYYENEWRKTFSTRISAGRFIQYSFGKELLSNWMISGLKLFPRVVGKLESLTHGSGF